MTHEEKLAEAKRLYKTANADQRYVLESLFPELAESEDERIKKSIIKFLIDVNNGAYTKSELEIASWIDWLEKQAQSTTITIPKDLKGTDTDGGVVGERGEQGEKQSKLVDFDYNANDSDLQEVTYFIPNGFHAEIDGNKVVIKRGEQKPAKWSEEDEKCIDNCCLLIGAADDCYEKTFKDDCIYYLQSLKERMEQ